MLIVLCNIYILSHAYKTMNTEETVMGITVFFPSKMTTVLHVISLVVVIARQLAIITKFRRITNNLLEHCYMNVACEFRSSKTLY